MPTISRVVVCTLWLLGLVTVKIGSLYVKCQNGGWGGWIGKMKLKNGGLGGWIGKMKLKNGGLGGLETA